MNTKNVPAMRGEVIITLYDARGMTGVNETLHILTPKTQDNLILTYFELLNQKKFEEAYTLQHSTSPSIENLYEYYGDATSIAVVSLSSSDLCGIEGVDRPISQEEWTTLVEVTNAA
jgi:hypothetical protein